MHVIRPCCPFFGSLSLRSIYNIQIDARKSPPRIDYDILDFGD
jgi:hypothetical protein